MFATGTSAAAEGYATACTKFVSQVVRCAQVLRHLSQIIIARHQYGIAHHEQGQIVRWDPFS